MISKGNKGQKKEVKKAPYEKDFYFTILYHLNQGLSPAQIARRYNFSKQRISYYIKVLKQNGIIEKVGYGVWKQVKEVKQTPYKVGNKHLMNNFDFPKETKVRQIRGHAFVFNLKLPNIKNWEKREEYLKKKGIEYKNVGIKRTTQSITIKKHKIWLNNKSITIYFPKTTSYFSDSAKSAKNLAIIDFLSLVRVLEHKLKTSFKINGNYLFSVSRQHYSLIKNELARYYNNNKKKLEVYQNGKLWFLIDNSFNLEEAECIDPIKSDIDADDKISPFFNSLRDAPFTAYDFHELAQSTKGIVEAQHTWAGHIESHTKAIIKLTELIDKLEKRLEDIGK